MPVAQGVFQLSTHSVDNFVGNWGLTAESPDFMRDQTNCPMEMQAMHPNKINDLQNPTHR